VKHAGERADIDPGDRIDPQMRRQRERLLDMLGPRGFQGIEDLHERRRRYEEVMALASARVPQEARVTREDVCLRENRHRPDLGGRLYRPTSLGNSAPALLYLHGGGLVMGSVAADEVFAASLAEDVSCLVLSVEYGLAPENHGTGPVEDCYDALVWLAVHADELGVDAERLAVFGSSAGGGLACGVALLTRDRAGPRLAYQMLIYPMLDDRNISCSSHAIVDLGIWDRTANLEAWGYLLGDDVGSDRVSAYAAPARATTLVGLPPTYIEVGDLDLFLDEDITLAQRLADSGVPVELHEHSGAYHGFDQLAPNSELARTATRNRVQALRRALATHPAAHTKGS
jgi:acetyl esterase/lipase